MSQDSKPQRISLASATFFSHKSCFWCLHCLVCPWEWAQYLGTFSFSIHSADKPKKIFKNLLLSPTSPRLFKPSESCIQTSLLPASCNVSANEKLFWNVLHCRYFRTNLKWLHSSRNWQRRSNMWRQIQEISVFSSNLNCNVMLVFGDQMLPSLHFNSLCFPAVCLQCTELAFIFHLISKMNVLVMPWLLWNQLIGPLLQTALSPAPTTCKAMSLHMCNNTIHKCLPEQEFIVTENTQVTEWISKPECRPAWGNELGWPTDLSSQSHSPLHQRAKKSWERHLHETQI